MSSSTARTRQKNAAIVGLGWWGQHILRQMIGSDIVRIVYAVGSREEHRAHADNFDVAFTTDFSRVLGDVSIDFVILATPVIVGNSIRLVSAVESGDAPGS
jgi:predicted dehydrogenase